MNWRSISALLCLVLACKAAETSPTNTPETEASATQAVQVVPVWPVGAGPPPPPGSSVWPDPERDRIAGANASTAKAPPRKPAPRKLRPAQLTPRSAKKPDHSPPHSWPETDQVPSLDPGAPPLALVSHRDAELGPLWIGSLDTRIAFKASRVVPYESREAVWVDGEIRNRSRTPIDHIGSVTTYFDTQGDELHSFAAPLFPDDLALG